MLYHADLVFLSYAVTYIKNHYCFVEYIRKTSSFFVFRLVLILSEGLPQLVLGTRHGRRLVSEGTCFVVNLCFSAGGCYSMKMRE